MKFKRQTSPSRLVCRLPLSPSASDDNTSYPDEYAVCCISSATHRGKIAALQIAVELFAKSNLMKLLQNRLVEPLTDAVSLGRLPLGLGVINVVDR